jgi:hypothetical protein
LVNYIDVTTVENQVIVSETGQPGPRGNSILNGVGAPTNTFPSNAVPGDFYINLEDYTFYGPLSYNSGWGDPVDLLTLPESVYTYEQEISQSTWTIPQSMHKLNFRPNVTVVNSLDEQVEGDVQYQSDNTVIIRFAVGFYGKAYLS